MYIFIDKIEYFFIYNCNRIMYGLKAGNVVGFQLYYGIFNFTGGPIIDVEGGNG